LENQLVELEVEYMVEMELEVSLNLNLALRSGIPITILELFFEIPFGEICTFLLVLQVSSMALMGDRNTQRLLDQKKRAEVRLIEQVRNAAKPGMPVFPPPVRLPNHEQDAMGDRIVSLFGSLPQKSHSTSNLMLESPQCETMEDFEVREAQRRMKERDQQKRISSSSTNRTSQDYDRNSAHSNGFGGNLQERGDRRPSAKISNGHGMSNGHASRQKSGQEILLACSVGAGA
jgi:hypothetical protein